MERVFRYFDINDYKGRIRVAVFSDLAAAALGLTLFRPCTGGMGCLASYSLCFMLTAFSCAVWMLEKWTGRHVWIIRFALSAAVVIIASSKTRWCLTTTMRCSTYTVPFLKIYHTASCAFSAFMFIREMKRGKEAGKEKD